MIICTDTINFRTLLGLAIRSNDKVIVHVTNTKTNQVYRIKQSLASGYTYHGKSIDNTNILFNIIGEKLFGINIDGDQFEYPIGLFIVNLIEVSGVE